VTRLECSLETLTFSKKQPQRRVIANASQKILTSPVATNLKGGFDLNAKLLLTLHYKKGQQGSKPGGHNFSLLNTSIKNKPFFVSHVVINNSQTL